jgi:hypothetical protein
MSMLEEREQMRLRFLKTLYDKTDGTEGDELDMWELGRELGLSEAETSNVVDYLNGEGLLAAEGTMQGVSLSHAGVVEVEQAMKAPQRPTSHFSPNVIHNVIHVDRMVNSQILQGSPGSTQSGTFSAQDMTAVLRWAAEVRASMPQLQFEPDDLMDAEASLATLEAQARARKPDATILTRAGTTVRGLVEAAAKGASTAIGSMLGQKLIASMPTILSAIP